VDDGDAQPARNQKPTAAKPRDSKQLTGISYKFDWVKRAAFDTMVELAKRPSNPIAPHRRKSCLAEPPEAQNASLVVGVWCEEVCVVLIVVGGDVPRHP